MGEKNGRVFRVRAKIEPENLGIVCCVEMNSENGKMESCAVGSRVEKRF